MLHDWTVFSSKMHLVSSRRDVEVKRHFVVTETAVDDFDVCDGWVACFFSCTAAFTDDAARPSFSVLHTSSKACSVSFQRTLFPTRLFVDCRLLPTDPRFIISTMQKLCVLWCASRLVGGKGLPRF